MSHQPTHLPGFRSRSISLIVRDRFSVKGGDLCRKNEIKVICLVCYILSDKLLTYVEQEILYSYLLTWIFSMSAEVPRVSLDLNSRINN